jgi:CRP-like cAMP-binding protein
MDMVLTMSTEALPKNTILQGAPIHELELILPFSEVVQLQVGDPIDTAGKPVQFLHFPLNSAISMTSIHDVTRMVEITLIGREGCSGSSVVQGDDRSVCSAMVQIPGTAVRLPTSSLVKHLPQLRYLGAALSRHTLLLMRHAVISVGCSAYHAVSQRLARWLQAYGHRTGIESFPVSVPFLSAQVGTAPHLVSGVLHEFQSHGIVKTGHDRVTITDHDALTKHMCECYELAKKATDEYLVALAEIVRMHQSPS